MKKPFKWDDNTDQAIELSDKEYISIKKKKEFLSAIKTFLAAIIILPFSLIMMPFVKRKHVDSNDFFSIGIDFTKDTKLQLELLEELDVNRVLLRLKLWEIDNIAELEKFILALNGKKIILQIVQDRENIEDAELFEKNLRTIFSAFKNLIDVFEIGSSVNKVEYGFFSIDEYNRFYKTAYDLKNSEFPNLNLIGSSVIDFEYHFTAHTLFNFCSYRYDGVSSQLYVDKSGAPENAQMGFTLSDKIAWLSTIVWLSPKSKQDLHITQTNYSIKGTKPFSVANEDKCVSEEIYADYMLRYYLLSFASQQVNSVSWHQLIASGYGLVDNSKTIKKRSAFSTYQFMIKNLKNAQFLRMDITRGYYILQCLVNNSLLQIHWSIEPTTLINEDYFEVFSRDAKPIKDEIIDIGSSPVYIYIKDKSNE